MNTTQLIAFSVFALIVDVGVLRAPFNVRVGDGIVLPAIVMGILVAVALRAVAGVAAGDVFMTGHAWDSRAAAVEGLAVPVGEGAGSALRGGVDVALECVGQPGERQLLGIAEPEVGKVRVDAVQGSGVEQLEDVGEAVDHAVGATRRVRHGPMVRPRQLPVRKYQVAAGNELPPRSRIFACTWTS